MIHDIILALLNPDLELLPIADIANSEVAAAFLHPGEAQILANIIRIIDQYRGILRYIHSHSNQGPVGSQHISFSILPDDAPVQKGLYVQAFTNGVGAVLEDYREMVVNLEKRYLKNPDFSLIFVYKQIEAFEPLFNLLAKLISGIKTQRLHGAAILQFLQEHSHNGNVMLHEAVKTIQKTVYVVFIKQLYQWCLYGKFIDNYGEFFIQHADMRNTIAPQEQRSQTTNTATTISESTSVNSELWRYEICYNLLPNNFPPNWAEKVLFIGQTVLMFHSDPKEVIKKYDVFNEDDKHYYRDKTMSMWGEQEYEFFNKFKSLQNEPALSIVKFEEIIDEIKACVTKHLSEIAVNDLVKQLKLIKDIYLLGRGELFLEFIKQTKQMANKMINDGTANRAFQMAASSVNMSDDIELFTFFIAKDEIDSFSYESKGFINYLTLNYKVKWPLHLLFSPKILERYNELFRFLLRIKKVQYDLHMVWCYHRETKLKSNSEVLHLRNKLMFLIDNLQYYLQVDVLESQFSILMTTVQESNDFEHIQRAHSIFQANVLSLCFLLTNNESSNKSVVMLQIPENPVLAVLHKILRLIDQFCSLSLICGDTLTKPEKIQFESFNQLFDSLVDSLLKILIGLKAGPSSAPLAQLLLRLDFNYWFSLHKSSAK